MTLDTLAIRSHLANLGFSDVINENVDFYNSPVPKHDFLITNPPYSGEHKQRILEFCVKQRRPFALLLPNYVAVKQYFKVRFSHLCRKRPASWTSRCSS